MSKKIMGIFLVLCQFLWPLCPAFAEMQWQVMGGDPWRGTLEQAIDGLGVPAELRDKFIQRIKVRDYNERVQVGEGQYYVKANHGLTTEEAVTVSWPDGAKYWADRYWEIAADGVKWVVDHFLDDCGNYGLVLAQVEKDQEGNVKVSLKVVNIVNVINEQMQGQQQQQAQAPDVNVYNIALGAIPNWYQIFGSRVFGPSVQLGGFSIQYTSPLKVEIPKEEIPEEPDESNPCEFDPATDDGTGHVPGPVIILDPIEGENPGYISPEIPVNNPGDTNTGTPPAPPADGVGQVIILSP